MGLQLTRKELLEFLRALDHQLTKPTRLLLIGGSAVSIAHSPTYGTTDIDPLHADNELLDLCERVASTMPYFMPIDRNAAGVCDAPWNFEDRLVSLLLPEAGLRYLQVSVPEAHDLILMKIARCQERDLEGMREIADHTPISLDRLVHLYRTEMAHYIGDARTHRLNFLTAVGRIFNAEVSIGISATLGLPGGAKGDGSAMERGPEK